MTAAAVKYQVPQSKSRSERKRTAKMLSAICELVKNGLSVSHAAEKLHVHHTTVGRWRKELPEFDAAILAAEAAFIDSQIANIRAAAKTSWQASAWLLERKWPAHFSQPQVQLSMPVKVEHKELNVLLDELNQSPEARRLLSPELFAALSGNSEPFTTEGKESAPAHEIKDISDSEQETS
jgi:hypothetical protein